jgi:hypothetical protein
MLGSYLRETVTPMVIFTWFRLLWPSILYHCCIIVYHIILTLSCDYHLLNKTHTPLNDHTLAKIESLLCFRTPTFMRMHGPMQGPFSLSLVWCDPGFCCYRYLLVSTIACILFFLLFPLKKK